MKKEVKIGIFFAGVLFILATFILIVGDIGALFKKSGYPLLVDFKTAAGLEKGTQVRMAGVKIGYVQDIRLRGIQAEALLNITPSVLVPEKSLATMASLGLLGEKYIEIIPGEGKQYCDPGDRIEGSTAVGFDQLGEMLLSIGTEIKSMSAAVKRMIGDEGSEGNINETLHNLAILTEDMKMFFAKNTSELSGAIQTFTESFEEFDQSVDEVEREINDFVRTLKTVVEDNRDNVQLNLENIRAVIEKTEDSLRLLNDAIEKITKGEGTLGQLIQKSDLYQQAEETVGDIKKMIKPVSSWQSSVRLRFDYYGDSDLIKSYLTFSFWPTSQRYLFSQLIHNPWKDKFFYSIQGGLRINDFSPRAGIMESKIGVGMDYYLLGDRIKISLESYDYNRNPRPLFRLWVSYSPSKYVYFLSGIDDFTLAEKREFFFGLGFGL
ncbi:MAG: MCE family protein [Candidatus Aminicenantes bacterium]|nr:MCE family protein [Candidatus Aminicenantes bacterium]